MSNSKKKKQETAIIFGASLIALVWLARLFIDSIFIHHISVVIVGLAALLVAIPLDGSVFSRGRKIDSLQASTYRNTFHMFVKFVLFGLLAILINVFQVSFIIALSCMVILISVNYIFLLRKGVRK
jgi:hypothetical protein